jgi:meso-butanediol dehydrogenase / (S,S)-butanediol dehydrogenase / diacetyl reductase
MSFENKVALVTGSTKGIGAQIARRFAAEGAHVMVTGRSEDRGRAVVAEIEADGGSSDFVAGDIAVRSDVNRVVRSTVDRFGSLDILVNNAAPVEELGSEVRITEESDEVFDQIVRVGLYGPVFTIKAVLPEMLKSGGGAIVNISSIAGTQAVDGLPSYACVKGALQSLTRQIAGDYGKLGIRSNCVVVGVIYHADSMAASFIGHPVVRAVMAERLLSKGGELGGTDDIAGAVLYLASDAAQYLNGVLLPVDGGLSCRSHLPDVARVLAEAGALGPDRAVTDAAR